MFEKARATLRKAGQGLLRCVRREEDDMRKKLTDAYEQDLCVCCLNPLEHKREVCLITQCQHRYHRPCLAKWATACMDMDLKLSCPICRDFIEECINTKSRKNIPMRDLIKESQKLPLRLPRRNALLLGMIPAVETEEEEEARLAKMDESSEEHEPKKYFKEVLMEEYDAALDRKLDSDVELVTVIEFLSESADHEGFHSRYLRPFRRLRFWH